MKNKKNFLAIVLMGLLVLTLVPAAVFAGYGSQQGQGIGYVDANGDGICDNWASRWSWDGTSWWWTSRRSLVKI